VINAVGAKFGGAATVLVDVLRAAISHRRVLHVTALVSPARNRDFALPLADNFLSVEVSRIDSSCVRRPPTQRVRPDHKGRRDRRGRAACRYFPMEY
jgi:hypothetical protein